MWHRVPCSCRTMPNMKNIFKFFFDYTMINVLSIFLHNIFKGNFFLQRLESPLSSVQCKGPRFNFFPQFLFFHGWNEWRKKNKNLGQLFQSCFSKGATFLGRKELSDSPTRFLGEKRIFHGEKGTMW